MPASNILLFLETAAPVIQAQACCRSDTQPCNSNGAEINILIITHNRNRHFYFANRLIEKTGTVTGIITGAKTVTMSTGEKIRRRIQKKEVWPFVRNRALNIAYRKYGVRFNVEKQEAEQHYFGGAKDLFYSQFLHLLLTEIEKPYRSVNDDHYVSLIKNHKPDIIAVMGTCLISRAIIKSAPYVLNLHTGLSPYYRGSHTNLWPIIENDQGRFGVTVHRMSTGIDSGIHYSRNALNRGRKKTQTEFADSGIIARDRYMVQSDLKSFQKHIFKLGVKCFLSDKRPVLGFSRFTSREP